MDNSTMNSTTPEASTNSTTHSLEIQNGLEFCVYIINFLFGLPTHSYVIWLIITGSGIAPAFFNLSLSICESCVCLNCLFFALSIWFSSRDISYVAQFLTGLSITGRPLFQCLNCFERYLAVVHPVIFLKFKPLRYRLICSTVAWIICLGSCLLCVSFSVSPNHNALTWFYSMQFLLFFSIQLFCCLAVLRALKQSGPGERGREREDENHMKRKAFYFILITTVNVVIIYVPLIILGFFIILTQQYSQGLLFTGLICYVLAGFVQPRVPRVEKLYRLWQDDKSVWGYAFEFLALSSKLGYNQAYLIDRFREGRNEPIRSCVPDEGEDGDFLKTVRLAMKWEVVVSACVSGGFKSSSQSKDDAILPPEADISSISSKSRRRRKKPGPSVELPVSMATEATPLPLQAPKATEAVLLPESMATEACKPTHLVMLLYQFKPLHLTKQPSQEKQSCQLKPARPIEPAHPVKLPSHVT
ncbi:uncharacterized protein LOC127430950 [Myxocyprinus asiaticus]|uniref:uncharacterized protein LOC127430950 n=1 Tax=Myxocyprinus asiaticus TaxID=70543 RepID=UPI0022231595|nr:uncharacterized protein LOC127430950 [Myxocyprinus asiaticus]